MIIVKFPVIVVVVYVATSLVNKDDYIIVLVLQHKVSFTHDRLGRCFRFVLIYACIVVFSCCYRFSMNKDHTLAR